MSDDPQVNPLVSPYFQTANDVTRLFDNLQALVPDMTTDIASLVIWNTIEDFYVKSTYRRENVSWVLNPGQSTLHLDPYSVDPTWRVCRFLEFTGLPNVRFIPPGDIVDLTTPVPDTMRSGDVLLALKPADFNTVLPYDLMTTYWETLLSGALYRLHLQPGKPYSDMNGATIHGKLYRSGIASARADIQAGHVRGGRAGPIRISRPVGGPAVARLYRRGLCRRRWTTRCRSR